MSQLCWHGGFDEASADEARNVITEARRSNVALYLLDPRGLTTYQQEGMTHSPAKGDFEPWLDRARVAREGLQWLAEQTGGFAAVNTTNFDEAVDHIVRETGTYYLIAYAPSNQRTDGKLRRIKVDVTRPGLRVRARQGYYAPRSGVSEGSRPITPASRLSDAISSLLPATGLTVRISSSAYKSSTRRKALLLVTASVEYPAEPPGSPPILEDRLEVHLQALDMEGKVRGSDRRVVRAAARASAEGPEGPPEAPRFMRGQVLLQTELGAGRYSLRVAAHSARQQRAGSMFANVDVPDFDAAPLSMSGLVIGGAAWTPVGARVNATVASMIPFTPTNVRDFYQKDEVLAFVRVYASSGSASSITMATKVAAEDGTVTFQAEERPHEADLARGHGAFDYLVRIPLKGMAAGRYRLTITCRQPGPGAAGATRETVLHVRALRSGFGETPPAAHHYF